MGKKKKAVNSPQASERVETPKSSPQATATSSTFEAACARIQKENQKHLEQINKQLSHEDESSDEEIEGDAILNDLTRAYSGEKGISSDSITATLLSGGLSCMICIENVRHSEKIWTCGFCYKILHISCVQEWARDCLHSAQKLTGNAMAKQTWSCPNCRAEHSAVPDKYLCFCGKTTDPPFDKWLCPHTCGGICAADLKPSCGHRCTLLCHPGPCPPCPKTLQSACYCGRSKTTRRCALRGWSCSNQCGKPLKCGKHKCSATCHAGDCTPCEILSVQKCNCGTSEMKVRCHKETWKCEKICRRPLSCGKHICQESCHKKGDCGPCPNAGIRTCPCGRKTYKNLKCTQDKVPTCLNTCEKRLSCGIHTCWEKCHDGDCQECLELVMKRCRCGLKSKQVPCAKEFTCDSKCGKPKPCGHICTRRCCPTDEQCPPCVIVCNKKLQCGVHKCQMLCHMSPCFPCQEEKEKTCPCGKTTMKFPCGTNIKTAKVTCRERCPIPPDCHHPERPNHKCHIDRCPPCSLICDQKLPCGHKCPAKCHSAVLTKVMPTVKPRGPWEPQPQATWQLVSKSCAPCQVPVKVDCFGEHGETEWPCHSAKVASCGRDCGRLLPCEKHHCALECHVVKNAKSKGAAGSNCENSCGKACTSATRPALCAHPCNKGCHVGDCSPCIQYVSIRCYCQATARTFPCKDYCRMSQEERDALKTCMQKCSRDLECGHRCFSRCHAGSCPDSSECKKMMTVWCSCKRVREEVVCRGTNGRNHKVKCDNECRKIKEETQRLKKESEALKQLQEAERRKRLDALEVERIFGDKLRRRRRQEFNEEEAEREEQSQMVRISAMIGAAIGLMIIGIVLNGYLDSFRNFR